MFSWYFLWNIIFQILFSPCVDTESNVDLSIMFFVCKKLTMFAYLYSYKWWGQSHLSHQISPVFSLLNFVNGLMVKLCVSTDCTTASIKKILIFCVCFALLIHFVWFSVFLLNLVFIVGRVVTRTKDKCKETGR